MLEELDTMRITACKAEEDYKLWLRFEDGLEGRVFLGNLLEIGAFQLWRDVREFEKVSVDPERIRFSASAATSRRRLDSPGQPGLVCSTTSRRLRMAKKKAKKGGKKKKKKKASKKKKKSLRLAGKKKAAGKKKSAKKKKKAGKKKKATEAAPPASFADTAASEKPSTAATSSARPALNPAAAWPFPTGSRP